MVKEFPLGHVSESVCISSQSVWGLCMCIYPCNMFAFYGENQQNTKGTESMRARNRRLCFSCSGMSAGNSHVMSVM